MQKESTLDRMYGQCEIVPERVDEIDRYYVRPIVESRPVYQEVADELGMPWWFVGVIHGLESGFDFSRHLHNGDPLTAPTVRTPAGRPAKGSPPFSWRESAVDALRLQGLADRKDWSLGVMLDRLERFNGLGYRKRGLPSPYLWSFSRHYERGKFVADGKLDPDAVSEQCGGATLIRRLEAHGAIDTNRPLFRGLWAGDTSEPAGGPPAAAASPTGGLGTWPLGPDDGRPLPAYDEYARAELELPGEVVRGCRDDGPGVGPVRRVQEWLNLAGTRTRIDGDFGAATEGAVRDFQARHAMEPTGMVGAGTWLALTAKMRAALAPVEVGKRDRVRDVMVAVAGAHLSAGARELTVRGERNSGPWVRLYLHGVEGDGRPWAAGFVCHVIAQAAHALGEAKAPFRRRVDVDFLVSDAKRDRRFVDRKKLRGKLTGAARKAWKLLPGTLFVARGAGSGPAHVGIVTMVGVEAFATIEGNANDEGVYEGRDVCTHSRTYSGTDFILLA